MRRVLFVCTGNVCRSPMAAAIFNDLAKEKGLSIRAESAGVAALKGRPMTPEAEAVLEEIGVRFGGEHRGRQVDGPMLDGADLVLTMGPWHLAEIRRAFGDVPHEVCTLPEYVGFSAEEEIYDPYGRAMNAYRAVAHQIFEYVDLLTRRLGE